MNGIEEPPNIGTRGYLYYIVSLKLGSRFYALTTRNHVISTHNLLPPFENNKGKTTVHMKKLWQVLGRGDLNIESSKQSLRFS